MAEFISKLCHFAADPPPAPCLGRPPTPARGSKNGRLSGKVCHGWGTNGGINSTCVMAGLYQKSAILSHGIFSHYGNRP